MNYTLKAMKQVILKSFCLLIYILIALDVCSQTKVEKVIQLSGIIIHNADSLHPIPYVNIGVKGTARGTASNYEGFFSLPVYQNDTVQFSAIGYDRATLVLPEKMEANRYSIIQTMNSDTIRLPESIIYPWPSADEFKQAFLDLDIPDDQMTIARKNLEHQKLREIAKTLPVDGIEATQQYLRNESKKYTYMGQYAPNHLLNPFAWIQFFKALKDGELKLEK